MSEHTMRVPAFLFARAAAVASLLTLNVAHAETGDATIAEALFRDGQALMQRQRIAEACAKFQASQAAQPALGTLLNLAVCHEREGKTASAWTEFSEVQATAARTQDAKRRAYAETRLQELAIKLTKIEIHVSEPAPDLRVLLDGRALPSGAWSSAIPIDPGEHLLEASAPGFRTFSERRAFDAKPGATVWQVPALEALPQAAAAPAPAPAAPAEPRLVSEAGAPKPAPAAEPAPSSDRATRRSLGWISAGVGVVGLGAGVAFELSARGSARSRDDICPPERACATQDAFQQAQAAHDDAKRSQLLGFVSGGVGLAALGVAGYLFWSGSDTRPGSAQFQVAPVVGESLNGLLARGRF
jgi:hypothetical protein